LRRKKNPYLIASDFENVFLFEIRGNLPLTTLEEVSNHKLHITNAIRLNKVIVQAEASFHVNVL